MKMRSNQNQYMMPISSMPDTLPILYDCVVMFHLPRDGGRLKSGPGLPSYRIQDQAYINLSLDWMEST